jgi:hypothetical protein
MVPSGTKKKKATGRGTDSTFIEPIQLPAAFFTDQCVVRVYGSSVRSKFANLQTTRACSVLARKERLVREPFGGVRLDQGLTATVVLEIRTVAGVGHVCACRETLVREQGIRRNSLAVARRRDGSLGLEADEQSRQHHQRADCHANFLCHKSSWTAERDGDVSCGFLMGCKSWFLQFPG